ncbi:MAG: TadE/TadG family type IV pilus assembly protein [Gammaproteobacteria bacterium]
MPVHRRISNGLRRLRDRRGGSRSARRKSPLSSSESGTASVEFAIVLPVFLLFLFGIIEFGSLFFLQNNMVNAAREAARSWSVQQLDAVTVAKNYLAGFGQTFNITATDGCTLNPKVQDVTVHIDTDAASASLINYLGLFTGGTLNADVTMRKEIPCS